jgi:outer membrane murein-binding lipoprotein Lpp
VSRASNTPLVVGAGALGVLLLAAAVSSHNVRRTAKKLEEKVETLVTDWIPTLLKKTSEHEGQFGSV